MKTELQEYLQRQRKNKRELQELNEALTKLKQTKNPDPKLQGMIEEEIRQRSL